MKRAIWYLRQLLPLTYRSHYRDAQGNKRFSVWKMWMGHAYAIEDYCIGRALSVDAAENGCSWQDGTITA